jgi:periplasmic divalent cation tolerance protein
VTDCVVVTVTAPSEAAASAIAEAAVRERLAACAQVQGPIRSTFRWQGQVDHAMEWYCHLKTTADRFGALAERIRALHPYEVPEIIAVPISLASESYAGWLRREVSGRS